MDNRLLFLNRLLVVEKKVTGSKSKGFKYLCYVSVICSIKIVD